MAKTEEEEGHARGKLISIHLFIHFLSVFSPCHCSVYSQWIRSNGNIHAECSLIIVKLMITIVQLSCLFGLIKSFFFHRY